MIKKLLKLATIALLVFAIAFIYAKSEKTLGVDKNKSEKVRSSQYGFPGWYGYYNRYYCPYHRIYHHWEFRCPRFNEYYRPWEREWKYPRPMLYRKKDQRDKVYWKLFNASEHTIIVYPQGTNPVKLAPWERERVYRLKNFKLRVGNNQLGFREFKTRKHYIKINSDYGKGKQNIIIEKTNNKDRWRNWGTLHK